MTPTALILIDVSASMRATQATLAGFTAEIIGHLPAPPEVRCLVEGVPFWSPAEPTTVTRTDWSALLGVLAVPQALVVVSDFVPSREEDLDNLLILQLEKQKRGHPLHTVVVDPSASDVAAAALLQWPLRPPWTTQDAVQLAYEVVGGYEPR